jgi:phenylalanyl-tRNA synthetase beta chain
MKISCNILKKHIKNSNTIDFLNIWDKFTIRTAEVEGVEIKGANTDGIVTGKIIECEKHPQSNKLHILKVDIGSEILQIVCGAPNVKVGLIGALVKVGGHIDGMEISVRPLVGVDSYGMMCSPKELGISDDHTGILELPSDTKIGIPFEDLVPYKDIIVEIDNKSLTHRPDLWGHYGIAREIAAITNHELLPLDLNNENPKGEKLNIKINNPELCYRYIGVKLSNIENNVTPLWMQVFLYYAGMRSINLLVDLTNYVMLELGQPMHAFDSRTVKNIEVGLAKDNTTYTTLDGTVRKLTHEELMIQNDGKYFAIAGVMGGLDSEVLPDTNSIVLESATFEPSTVRKTAIRLGLRTEASSRYEKSLDPNMAILATRRFIYILKELNPNLSFSSTITDVYPTIQKENEITLNKDLLYKYMGFKIDDEVVKNILTSLEFKVTINKDNYLVTAPTFRSTKDITIAADVIEEISRMYGYENFEHLPLKMDVTFMPKEESFDSEYDLKYYLSVKYHLHEINTYLWNKTSFLKKLNININNVKLLGKTDDNILRNDLSLSMLENASYNIKNYENFGLFEIGTTIINNECERHLSIILVSDLDKIKDSYYQIKDIATNIYKELKNLNVKFNTSKAEAYYNNDLTMSITGNDQVLGEIKVFNREVSNKISKKKAFVVLDLNIDTFTNLPIIVNNYTEISKYPTTVLDYTIITKKGTFYENLDSILNKFSSPIILKRELVDIYLNDENKKVTIRYTVGAQDKTLTSEELTNFKEEFIKFINQNGLSITLE